ncbi:hypothetical protein [Streptomyces sp. NPDC020996]|uniref:hypothetical protein n=1 Tax=Streptomyces sp. NPDC020996 TaxID=3154791 RepID=UPI0033F891B7
MGATIHAHSAEQFAGKLRQTDDGRRILASYRDLIADRNARPYVDAIAQPYSGWSDGQVAALARVDALVASGAVRKVRVPVDATPGRDRDRAGNLGKLTRGLPPEFSAEVYEGLSHDGDGLLSWSPEAPMPWTDGRSEFSEPLSAWHSWAPLEIGHTDASRTVLHLAQTGIVARWPYRSEDVWVFSFASYEAWADWGIGSRAVRA